MEKFTLFRAFAEKIIGRPLESVEPQHLSGWQCVSALWPLNERFRPNLARIRALPYDADFAGEADTAIERLLVKPEADWADLSAGAWRVLLERQQQAIMLSVVNERAGNPVTVVPPGFSDAQMTVAVALNLLHGMELPWPPQDRAGFDIPPASALGSLRPH